MAAGVDDADDERVEALRLGRGLRRVGELLDDFDAQDGAGGEFHGDAFLGQLMVMGSFE